MVVLLAPPFCQRPRDDVGTPVAGHAERDLPMRHYSAQQARRPSRFPEI
jgi:hypothetical protein